MSQPDFSFDNFKKWMNQQNDYQPKRFKGIVGTKVESKVPAKRLGKIIDIEEGTEEEVIAEFCASGGTITESEGKTFIIEVASGLFRIPRNYVKRIAS